MEHATTPVTINVGDRAVILRFNARAWRLIQEKTGFNYLKEQRLAAEAVPEGATEKERQRLYGEMIGEKLKGLLTDTTAVPVVLWAISQNPDNGLNGQRPTLDFIEDYLFLDAVAIGKISDALRTSFESGLRDETLGNAPTAQNPLTGSTSGPLDAPALV